MRPLAYVRTAIAVWLRATYILTSSIDVIAH